MKEIDDDYKIILNKIVSNMNIELETNDYFMNYVINEAKKSKTELKIGAIIVKNDIVIASGHRKRSFKDNRSFHAEEICFNNLNSSAKGGIMYLTLEPCIQRNNKYQNVLSCTDLIIKNKIEKVVIGVLEINPDICGRSIQQLYDNGVNVSLFDYKYKKALYNLLGKDFIEYQFNKWKLYKKGKK